MIKKHSVVEWGIIDPPHYVKYFHQILKDNCGSLYFPQGGSVELNGADEMLYPQLKDLRKIYLIYNQGH